MKQSKILYFLLAVSLVLGMTAFAAPAEIVGELYDYSATYTMTENFDVEKTSLVTEVGQEAFYSPILKAKVFATDTLTNVNVAEGKFVTAHKNDEVGLSFVNPIPGPAEYVLDNNASSSLMCIGHIRQFSLPPVDFISV